MKQIEAPGHDPHDKTGARCDVAGSDTVRCHRRAGHGVDVFTRYDEKGDVVETELDHVAVVGGRWYTWSD